MKFLLSIGPMLRMAALVVALSQATAAENKRDALTIRVAQGGWGDASVENIEQVLRSAAEQIHRFCPVTPKPILVEHGSGSPIVFYRKGPNGETLVKLNVTGRYWAQFAYQFAHEFCHICCGYQNNQGRTNLNQWFEESLCETASLFAIRRMAVAWKTNPPYPNWRDFAKHLDSYAANLLEAPERKLPPGTTFASWFALNESKLRENGGGNPTLRDVKVRQALAMATDKRTLVDLVHLGYAEPGTTIVQKAASYWWDANIHEFEFNITKANELLNESGYLDIDSDGVRESPNGSVEMSYTLLVLSRWPEEMRTGQQLQTWWAQIGVRLEVVSADANTINSYVYPDYNQDMFLWGYSGQPDPSFSLLIMLSTQVGDWNDCGYRNASYDELYDQQAKATDPEQRREIVYQMQEIIYYDCPYIVLYYMTAKGAYRLDTFTGFVNMPTGLLSDVNTYTLREVHLIKGESAPAKTDYLPWAVAGIAIVVAVAAIAVAMSRKGRGGKPEQKPEETKKEQQ